MEIAPSTPADEPRVDVVIAAYLRDTDSGRCRENTAWLTQYPEVASDLEEFFRNQDFFRARLAKLAGKRGDFGLQPKVRRPPQPVRLSHAAPDSLGRRRAGGSRKFID